MEPLVNHGFDVCIAYTFIIKYLQLSCKDFATEHCCEYNQFEEIDQTRQDEGR